MCPERKLVFLFLVFLVATDKNMGKEIDDNVSMTTVFFAQTIGI
jgi:hypothetical protein